MVPNFFMQTSTQLLGPNNFPFNRLVMIFQSITENQVTLSVNLLSQVHNYVYLYYISVKVISKVNILIGYKPLKIV